MGHRSDSGGDCDDDGDGGDVNDDNDYVGWW